MPAIFGINRTAEVAKHLEELIGIPLFEIPNMPPSIPGLRLKGAFETDLQQKVLDVHKGKNEDYIFTSGQHHSDQAVKPKGIILAPQDWKRMQCGSGLSIATGYPL